MDVPEEVLAWAQNLPRQGRRHWMVSNGGLEFVPDVSSIPSQSPETHPHSPQMELHRLYVDWGYFGAAPGDLDGLALVEVLGYYRDSHYLELRPDQEELEADPATKIPGYLENVIMWKHCLFLWIALRTLDRA